jgi:soluble lytic murein transglycosylase-like protein
LQAKRFAFLVTLVAVLHAVSAQAEIYAWRDEHGRLVLSKHPAPAGIAAQTFSVGGSDAYRVTGDVVDVSRLELESRLRGVIENQASQQSLSPDLVRAVIRVESNWNPRAQSAKGALGLMQLMPATAAEYGVSDPFNPEQNIRAGVKYLRKLVDRFDGKTELALAAYNAGPAPVAACMCIPPIPETVAYVASILGLLGGAGDAMGMGGLSVRLVR